MEKYERDNLAIGRGHLFHKYGFPTLWSSFFNVFLFNWYPQSYSTYKRSSLLNSAMILSQRTLGFFPFLSRWTNLPLPLYRSMVNAGGKQEDSFSIDYRKHFTTLPQNTGL